MSTQPGSPMDLTGYESDYGTDFIPDEETDSEFEEDLPVVQKELLNRLTGIAEKYNTTKYSGEQEEGNTGSSSRSLAGDTASVLQMTRFTKEQLEELCEQLFNKSCSKTMHYYHQSLACSKPAVLAIVAACMQREMNFDRLEQVMDKPRDWIAIVYNITVTWLYKRYKHVLDMHSSTFDPNRLEIYAAAMKSAGAPEDNLWGVLDTVFVPVTKSEQTIELYDPTRDQYGYKYQLITAADGLILHLWGPEPACLTDQEIYNISDMSISLRDTARGVGNRQMCVAADDSRYKASAELVLLPNHKPYPPSWASSAIRQLFPGAVEEPEVNDIDNEFGTRHASQNSRVFVAAVLSNCNVIMNNTPSVPGIPMLSLDEYIHSEE